jgi:hypothetical protein
LRSPVVGRNLYGAALLVQLVVDAAMVGMFLVDVCVVDCE